MPKKYLLYIHDDRFEKETNKSALVNKLLAEFWSGAPSSVKVEAVKQARKPKPALLDIPSVELASEAKCKGTHYMSRANCGKQGCPWK